MKTEDSFVSLTTSDRDVERPLDSAISLLDQVGVWTENNIARPAINSAIINPANALSNATAGFTGRLNELHVPKPTGATSEFFQTASSALGGLAPYLVAGKLTGGVLRNVGNGMPVGSTLGRACQSEMLGMIAGAGIYDYSRDLREGETHAGNMVSGMAAFTAFGLSKYITSDFAFTQKLLAQAGIGALAGEGQLIVSKVISGGRIETSDIRQAAYHGAVTNMLLPAGQHKIDRLLSRERGSTHLNTITSNSFVSALHPAANEGATSFFSSHGQMHSENLHGPTLITKDISIVHGTPGARWEVTDPIRRDTISSNINYTKPGELPITADPIFNALQERALAAAKVDLSKPVETTKLPDGNLLTRYADGTTVRDVQTEGGLYSKVITRADGTKITESAANNYFAGSTHTVFPDGSEICTSTNGVVTYQRPTPQPDGSVVIDRLGPLGREQVTLKDGVRTVRQNDGTCYESKPDASGRQTTRFLDTVLRDGTIERYPESGPYRFERVEPNGTKLRYFREPSELVSERTKPDGSSSKTYRTGRIEEEFTAPDKHTYEYHRGGRAIGMKLHDGTRVIMPQETSRMIFKPDYEAGPELAGRYKKDFTEIEPTSSTELPDGSIERAYADGLKIQTHPDGTHSVKLTDGGIIHGRPEEGALFVQQSDGNVRRISRSERQAEHWLDEQPLAKDFRFPESGLTVRYNSFEKSVSITHSDGSQFRLSAESNFHNGEGASQQGRFDSTGREIDPISTQTLFNGVRKEIYTDSTIIYTEPGGNQSIKMPDGRELNVHYKESAGHKRFLTESSTKITIETIMPDGARFVAEQSPFRAPTSDPVWIQTNHPCDRSLMADGTVAYFDRYNGKTSFTLPDGTLMRVPQRGRLIEQTTHVELEGDLNHDRAFFADPQDLPQWQPPSMRPSESPYFDSLAQAQAHRLDNSGRRMEPVQVEKSSGGDILFKYEDGVTILNEHATENQITTMPNRTQFIWTKDSVFIRINPDGSRFLRYPDTGELTISRDGTVHW